jgi:hypothetical protein
MTSEDVNQNGFRNVVSKFTLHSVQKPQSQKTVGIYVSNIKFDVWFKSLEQI